MKALVATLLCLLPCAAFARIGETQIQVEARLGRSAGGAGPVRLYEKGGYFVLVTYENGVSVCEIVSRPLKREPLGTGIRMDRFSPGEKFSNDEIAALLSVYSQGATWNMSDSYAKRWVRSDGAVLAVEKDGFPCIEQNVSIEEREAYREAQALFFVSTAYERELEAKTAAQKAKEVDAKKRDDSKRVTDAFGNP